jgi:hypothetical protein
VEEIAVDRRSTDCPGVDGQKVEADVQRIAQVLAGLAYPAAKWQVLAEADHYGADSASRRQLWTLPAGSYRNLAAVLVELGLLAGGRFPPVDGAPRRTRARPRR